VSGLYETVLRPALFFLEPERAHRLSILALKTGIGRRKPRAEDAAMQVSVAGITFPNPLGLAAGYDKNAEVPAAVLGLGFGFTEVGTLTPRPQPGNPRPRLFRLAADEAVINRMGFNNDGHAVALKRLASLRHRRGIIGVNIGANKDSADRPGDYSAGIHVFNAVADYFTVNISSPNTPGLRNLQAREHLRPLLERVLAARNEAASRTGASRPVFLKIAPDLAEAELDDIAEEIARHPLDGLVVANTTLSRAGLADRARDEAGGLSGRPLFERSTIVLAKMRERVGPGLPIIGVGGIDSVESAIAKIRAGADLLQLYTGLIYRGPSLPGLILSGLRAELARVGAASIAELRDRETRAWAGRAIDDGSKT